MTSMAESARPWRCFWAVPLPVELRASLSGFVARLRAAPGVEDDWRFTEADSWHVTLAFLGGIPKESVEPMVMRVAAAVEGTSPFDLTVRGLEGFNGHRGARVLWVGVHGDGKDLRELAAAVRSAAGLPDEADPFRAHVTLARSRNRLGAPLPQPDEEPPAARVPVDEVVLLRSHLGRGPANYEAIARVPLSAPAAVGPAGR
jgi:2'-5' RNA ligase